MPHPPQGLAGGSKRYQVSASDDLIASADTVRNVSETSYIEVKRIKVNVFGTLRTYFEMCAVPYSGYINTVYGRVYRNGLAVGTERSTFSTSYVAFTEDISGWMEGDFCQLYAYQSGNYVGPTGSIRNFRIKGQIQVIASPTTARVDID
jgi:hypothetical protein